MKLFFKISKFLIELAIFLAASFLMFYITYYFGWSLLPGELQWGNDIPSALNNVYYLEEWYPPIPKWIHLWAGGMPFLALYPAAPFLVTFFIHKIFALSIYQAAKLVMFFSIPLAASGVLVLGRILTKNWFAGILAGVIMILSPDSWFWVTIGGFYAMASSVPLFAWTLVFFSLAMQRKSYLLSIITAILYGMTWYFHPNAGVLAAVTMAILGFGFGYQEYGLKFSWKGLLKATAIITIGILLFAWWIFPFLTREEIGGIGISSEDMYRVSINEILGLVKPVAAVYVTSTVFSASFIVLFALGVFVSIFRKGIMRWVALASLVALFIMTAPHYVQPIVKTFNLFWTVTNIRAALIIRILGAVVAGYGAVSIARPVFWLIERFAKGLKENKIWGYSTGTVSGIVGVLLFLFILKNVIIFPPLGEDVALGYPGYGPFVSWVALKRVDGQRMTKDLETGEFTIPLIKDREQILKELPGIFSIVGGGNGILTQQTQAIVKGTKVNSNERVDVSPVEGQIAGSLGNSSQVSQIQAYFGSSLIQRMVGWQIYCVYYNPLCQEEDVRDIYNWFGVSQVWRDTGALDISRLEMKERLDSFGFLEPEKISLDIPKEIGLYWNIYHVKNSTGLANITNKPAILVIGDNPPNKDVFDSVFRSLSRVGFGYKDAWSVKGKRYIDDYSLSELEKFEGIILHGYGYHDKQNAWKILKQYVEGGGNLFVNTGWQYMAADWGKLKNGRFEMYPMPDLLPVNNTLWGTIDQGKWDLKLAKGEISKNVTTKDWGKPLWSEQPWGVAYATRDDLKEGAEILLQNKDKILVASWSQGKGKVVWTGFDFWGHLVNYKAQDEKIFVQNSLKWLFGGNYKEEKLNFDRKTPDFIKIPFTKEEGRNKLLFKEVANDNWKATLIPEGGSTKELKIFKAGPGWKMVFLPDDKSFSKGQIIFSYQRNKTEWFGLVATIMTVILVLAFGLLRLTGKRWDRAIFAKIKNRTSTRIKKAKSDWKNEEEY